MGKDDKDDGKSGDKDGDKGDDKGGAHRKEDNTHDAYRGRSIPARAEPDKHDR